MTAFKPHIAKLHQSGIRRASQRCAELGGINLGQGICDIPIHPSILAASNQAMQDGHNLYGAKEGLYSLRQKLAEKIQTFNRIPVQTENVMVSHGSTGSFVSAVDVLFEKGDEILLFEPFYGYHKKLLELRGLTCRSIPMQNSDFSFAIEDVKAAIGPKTKGIIVCTPCNPSGKVFSKDELLQLGRLAKEHKLWVLTDEIYERITYPGHEHVSLASLEDFFSNTITISGFSKTFNMTGWRLGYASGPDEVIEKMTLVQDLVYICPAVPLQYGALAALNLPNEYFAAMQKSHLINRDFMVPALQDLGFGIQATQGSYYLMADFSKLGFANDVEAVDFFLENARVATVTGSSFFTNKKHGEKFLRFCFGLSLDKLQMAVAQMQKALSCRSS